MKKFILIDHEPWTVRRKELFYDLFEKAGLDLEVWDMSQVIFPGISNSDQIKEAPYLKKIESEEEFISKLNQEDITNIVIIVEIFRNWKNRRIFKILSDRKVKTVKIELYGNTVIPQPFISKLSYIRIQDICRIIKNKYEILKLKLYNRLNNVNSNADIILSSSAYFKRDFCFNHPDYEKFMFEDEEPFIEGNYIVFCDVYFPFHSEMKYLKKIKKIPDGAHYQFLMRKYFDYLEKKYKMPVVIAAHPKSNYSGNEFGNRRIIKYRTDNLVRHASMVTMHLCNSVSYSILGNKPLAYIVTNDYLTIPNFKNQVDLVVKSVLGLDYYNIENEDYQEKFKFEKVNNKIRENYIYSLLTSRKTENQKNSDTLKRIFSNL